MRRLIAGSIAFTAFTATLLTVPVYAAPGPTIHPVEPSIEQVVLGSVDEPETEAVVTVDGVLVAAGDEAEVTESADPADPGTPAPSAAPTEPPGAAPSEAPTEAPTEAPSATATETPSDAPVVDVPTAGTEVPGVPVLTVSQTDTDQFSAVGVTWAVDEGVTGVTVQIRAHAVGADWGTWTALEAEDAEQSADSTPDQAALRAGTAPYYTGPADGLEVVVQALDGSTPRDVRVEKIDPGTSAADTALGPAQATDQAHAALSMPPIYSRAQWGADESIRTWDPEFSATIKAATVHHTADSNNYSADAVPGILRSIYAYHTVSRGWGDIGYNVIVDKYGRAWEGRYSGDRGIASPIIGAHAGGFNTSTFGVSMLGNYAEAPTTQPMVDMVAAVIGWKLGLYGVEPSGWTTLTSSGGGTSKYEAGVAVNLPTVFGHRDVGNTTCPGNYGYGRLTEIRATASAIASQRSTPMGAIDAVTPSFGRAVVSGWAVDLDTPQRPIDVHAYVDGVGVGAYTADRARGDITRVAPNAGPAHGFAFTLDVAAGVHTVCIYAINAGAGTDNPQLGCRTVSVPGFQATPVGSLDGVRPLGARIGLSGWALDGSAPTQPVAVHVYVDGQVTTWLTGDQSRPDVGAVYPGAGDAHGFSGSVAASPGAHRVCVYAINTGTGSVNPEIGCTVVNVPAAVHAPVGAWDITLLSGSALTVNGWVVDPDAPTTSGQVHVYVDGKFATAATADVTRNDITAYFAGLGVSPRHGYRTTLSLHAGPHQVCVFAINQGAGTDNPVQACNTVTVPAEAWNPVGVVDSVSVSGITATVTGWAFDPDIPNSPSRVHVYVDGVFRADVAADGQRPDVGSYYGVGNAHGLRARVSVEAGTHTLCAYVLNSGDGTAHPSIGCRTVTVSAAAWASYGTLDGVAARNGQVSVSGWAIDTDDPARTLAVHVYVNGVGTALVADASRPDVGQVYPAAGPRHGISAQIPAAGPGPYQVCAWAIGVGDGTTNVPLGCRTAP
jgi:hypothetical protein